MDTATIINLTAVRIMAIVAITTNRAIMGVTTIINPDIIHGGNINGDITSGDITNGATIRAGNIVGVTPDAAIYVK